MQGAEVLTKFTADTKDFDSKTKKVNVSLGSITKGVLASTAITKAFSAAWGMVTNNLDDAIDRFDILNNFPKVMSNLGIGANESQEAIDKLSDKLTGLPTTLQDGALAVQRLTSKNGDIKKSTNLFLAMNNAILAGGASSQLQSTAIEQLSQAYAKGKPDMMEWRSLMSAMPAQLKQVATAMGYVDADTLGEALRDGSVSMDVFMETINKLNTEGINGFQSFEEQARNSTGGIRTSITNMKSRVTQGVTEVIKAIDEGLKQANLGGFSTVFETIGNTIRDTLKKIAPYITKVVVVAAQWLPKIIGFIKSIAPVLAPILAGLAAYNAVVKTIQIATGLWQAAQMALNVAMSLNPIGLIIAGIVALIAIVALLWTKCEWFRNGVMAIFEVVVSVVTSIFETVTNIATAIWEFLQPIFDFIKNAIILVVAVVATTVEAIFNVLKPIFEWIYNNVINPIIQRWQAAFTFVIGVVKGAAEGIKNIFNGIVNFVKSAFEKIKTFISTVFKPIAGIIKSPINGIIKGVNGVLKTMNKIKIPDWVPGIGGKGVNFKLIPQLAKGTNEVLGEGLAYLHEGEAVVPKKYNPVTGGLGYLTKEFQKLVADTMTLSPSVVNSASLNLSPKIENHVHVDVKQDSLGQFVNDIKTFSGGAKNDFNYGAGV